MSNNNYIFMPEYEKYLIIENIVKTSSLVNENSFKINYVRNQQYSSINVDNTLLCRIKIKNETGFLSIKSKYTDILNKHNISYNQTKSEPEFVRVIIENSECINDYKSAILEIFKKTCSDIPSESFGCCSNYVECSDVMKCVHTDFLFSRGCIYRKNLENGKIFYGKNINI